MHILGSTVFDRVGSFISKDLENYNFIKRVFTADDEIATKTLVNIILIVCPTFVEDTLLAISEDESIN